MNPHQWFLMGFRAEQQPNTFIGGMGIEITDVSLLASYLGISSSRISSFEITGADISCLITGGSYSLIGAKGKPITYFLDLDGLVTNISNFVFRGHTAQISRLFFPGIINQTSANIFQDSSFPILFEMPNCISIPNSFTGNTRYDSNPIFYIPRCVNIGSSNLSDGAISGNFSSTLIIYANPVLQTSNDGAEEGDLAFARSKGAIIRYVTNFTAPNPVTDLAVTQVWEDAVKLSWTTPSGTNTIDFYELYQNGIFVKNVTGNEAIAANLQPSTNYTFKLIAVDIFFNKSTVSNVVSQTTNALGSGLFVSSLVPKLISSYRLNSDLVDVVNGYNGTGTAITYAAGKVGNAAVFNGTSSFISIADQTNFSFTDGTNDKPFSISMWVKYAGTGDGWLINKRSGGTSNLEWQLIKYQGKLGLWLFSANSNATYKVSEIAFTPVVGTWYHFAVTYDGVNYPKIYINAILQATTNATNGTYTAMQNTSAPIILGKAGWTNGLYFNGSQDAVHIFNTELTATEISGLYAFEDAGGQLI